MMKFSTLILTFSFFVNLSFGQLQTTGHKIINDHYKLPATQLDPGKRSVTNPAKCGVDTIQYPLYKSTGQLYFISISQGRSLGQLYSTPKPVTIYGFSFYSFVWANPPSPKKITLRCNLYKAGADSLPTGLPLRTAYVTIDSTLGGGTLSKVLKRANFGTPITMDSAYILTVENDSVTVNAGVVVNNFNQGNGRRENLNSGSISGVWYNGRNLNIGSVPFDADVLLHPHVKFNHAADFSIKSNCYNLADSIKFINVATKSNVGSKMYNRFVYYGWSYYCNQWEIGDGMWPTAAVDLTVKYSQKQNYQIRLVSTVYGYNGPHANGCSDTAVKWLLYKPDFPSVSGTFNACIGDTAKFTVTNADTGSQYEWYRKISDNTPFFKGTVYKKFPLTKSDTFYVRANNRGCVTSHRMVILNVNAYPSNLKVLNDSICAGSKASLTASANVGNIEWFASAVSPSVLYTGNVFQTPVLSKDTFFYVQANNKGCRLNPRVRVDALVGANFAPAPPALTPDTIICMATTSLLNLNATAGSGLTVRWFDAGSGSPSIHTGNSFTFIPVKREIKTFYADVYNGVCGSTRVPVIITVEDYPKISKIFKDTICLGDSLISSVIIPFGEADWYDNNNSLIYTGERYAQKPVVSGLMDYFIETRNSVCKSPTRTKITGLVNTFPSVTKLWGDTICAKNKAVLKSKYTGPGTIHWYEYDTSSASLGSGKTFQTFILNGAKSFYGQPEYAGCYGPKQIATPKVLPLPFPGFSYQLFANNQSVKLRLIKPTSAAILWDLGDGQTSKDSNVTHFYPVPGTYRIKLILTDKTTGCQDSMVIPVTVALGGVNKFNNSGALKMYPNPSQFEMYVVLPNVSGSLKTSIYSMDGKLIITELKELENNKIKIETNGLKPGIYTLQIEGYQSMLFVKE